MRKALLFFMVLSLMIGLFAVNVFAENEGTTAQITTAKIQDTTQSPTSTLEEDDDTDESDTNIATSEDDSSVEATLPDQDNDDDYYFSFGSINWGVYIIFSIVAAVVIGAIIILANPTDRKK